jgi:2-methylisocitrate lyase-like PEP mutase family enzyme
MAGKTVIPVAEAVGKLKAVLDARVHCLVVARTDAAPAWLDRLKTERSTIAFQTELATLADMNTLTGAEAIIAAGSAYGNDR